MKKILLSLMLLLGFFCANGQETARKSVFYHTDGYMLSRKQKTELNAFLDSAFKAGKVANIIMIEGHTDSAASDYYNIKLSARRSKEVQEFIKAKGNGNLKIKVKNYGETKPRFKYISANAMERNRRVDIEIFYEPGAALKEKDLVETTILDLYKLLETAADTFYIDNNFDTVLHTTNGVIVNIPSNTICVRENKKQRVKVAIKKVQNIASMISQNASTGSGGNLLITDGMIQITAFTLQNKLLQICDHKHFTILMPTDEPDKDIQLFYASRDENYALDWELQNPEEKLEIINSNLFNKCYEPNLNNSNGSGGSGRCRLFFCRIKNAIHSLFRKTISSKKEQQAGAFTGYQQRQLANDLIDLCTERKVKLKKLEEKFKGLKSGKLKDITAEDASYYIFNVSQMGWINCDRYLGLPSDRLTNIVLPMKSASTTDVKLVLSKNKAVMPSYNMDGNIGFPNVPKGEKAKLLGLKFENGQPALALQEITIGDYLNDKKLEFKDYSLSEPKKMLVDL